MVNQLEAYARDAKLSAIEVDETEKEIGNVDPQTQPDRVKFYEELGFSLAGDRLTKTIEAI